MARNKFFDIARASYIWRIGKRNFRFEKKIVPLAGAGQINRKRTNTAGKNEHCWRISSFHLLRENFSSTNNNNRGCVWPSLRINNAARCCCFTNTNYYYISIASSISYRASTHLEKLRAKDLNGTALPRKYLTKVVVDYSYTNYHYCAIGVLLLRGIEDSFGITLKFSKIKRLPRLNFNDEKTFVII